MYQVEEGFLKEEEREGFVISEMMKRAWASYIKIYMEIRALCDKYGLKHFAAFGTMLGVVRHKGFIPWDDDIDIIMPRKDYMEFLSHADEMPAPYRVKSIYNQYDFSQFHAVVSNSRAEKLEWDEERIKEFFGCPFIVGVDIFPYDDLPDDPDLLKLQELLYYLGYSLNYDYKEKKDTEEYRKILGILNEKTGAGFEIEDPDFLHNVRLATDKIAMLGQDKECSYVEYFPRMVASPGVPRIDKKWIENLKEMPFENITMPVPCGYHEMLSIHFGPEYMTPVRYGAVHNYPFYASQEEYFRFTGDMV